MNVKVHGCCPDGTNLVARDTRRNEATDKKLDLFCTSFSEWAELTNLVRCVNGYTAGRKISRINWIQRGEPGAW